MAKKGARGQGAEPARWQLLAGEVDRKRAAAQVALEGRDTPEGTEAWFAAGRAWRDAVDALEAELRTLEVRLSARDPGALDPTLSFLELDPWFYRSGYAKQRLLSRLRGQAFDAAARERLTALVVRAVEQGTHRAGREYARLVRAFATNPMRRSLRHLTRSDDLAAAWRATYLLLSARHPGLDADDLAAVRNVIRQQAARYDWTDWNARVLAMRLWSDTWEAELLARSRSERDLGARRLLEARRQYEKVREYHRARRAAQFEK